MIQIYDKTFELFLSKGEIDAIVRRLATEISNDMRELDPLICPVLDGSFMFATDLVRALPRYASSNTAPTAAPKAQTASTSLSDSPRR